MILKQADDRTMDLAILASLSRRADAAPDVRKRIEQEIRNIQAGVRGEKEAAYEMEFHFGASKNWMVLHDVRLEWKGRVAQIDHLLVNRFLEIYLCESKHFSEGISVNDHGEFNAFFNGKPYGIPSPVEQNRRHAAVLEAMFKEGAVALPTRLGFAMTPAILPLVLVATKARISRPKGKVDGLETVIKCDQLRTRVDRDFDDAAGTLGMAKVAKLVGQDTLEVFARRLVASHRPVPFNWPARFGLPLEPPATVRQPDPAGSAPSGPEGFEAPTEEGQAAKSKLVCVSCAAPVTYAVAKFCWVQKPRFGGNVYCMECQKGVPKPA